MKLAAFSLCILLLAFGTGGCKPLAPTTLYVNAVIWTGNPEQPLAAAMALSGEKIVAIGSKAEIEKRKTDNTTVIDLKGKFVTPGLTDSHTHFMSGGFQLASVDLRSADSPKEFIRRIAEFAKKTPKGRWITGGDWDHERWGGQLPDRRWIDSVTTEHPVFVSRLDGHMALANSQALKHGAVSKETPEILGGAIVRDINGEPTGVLKDEAMNPVWEAIPADNPEQEDEAFLRAQTFATSLGITQVHDMGQWAHLQAYRRAESAGKLNMRIYSFVPLAQWSRLADYIKTHGKGNDWLRWGGVKGFVDGSLGSTTAWFFDPYLDEPHTRGLTVTDTTQLTNWIREADKAGLQLAIHAIGDRANSFALDAFRQAVAANGPRDRRFRVEHAQHLNPTLATRFAQEHVVASMQPYHAIDDGRWAAKRIGPRIAFTYMFKSLLTEKAVLAFGSDWTVAPINPLEGIYAAVTRRTLDDRNPNGWVPQQKISVEDALRAYTTGCAYAGFTENHSGMLAPGKWADFVVFSENLLKVDPINLPKVKVLQTIIGGKMAYRASSS